MGFEEGSNYFIILYYFLLTQIFFKRKKNNQHFQGSDQEEKNPRSISYFNQTEHKAGCCLWAICGHLLCPQMVAAAAFTLCSCYTLLERKNAADAPPSSGALSSTHP
jgi:hypothetical protein